MTVIGFILISCAPAREVQVYDEVTRIKEVVEVHSLFGEFDIIAKVVADGYTEIGDVTMTIRELPGVVDTKTLTSPQGFF